MKGSNIQVISLAYLFALLDLQAKAYVLNTSMFNGEYGSSSCEEPEEVFEVKVTHGDVTQHIVKMHTANKKFKDTIASIT